MASGLEGLMKSLEALGKLEPPKEVIKWEKGAVSVMGPSFPLPLTSAVGQRGLIFGVSDGSLSLKLIDDSFHHGVLHSVVEASSLKDSDIEPSSQDPAQQTHWKTE